ncbi:unnamed protein product [Nesidiocoris tenuis]|uniref:snRNA-activating protein complex subunit 3 n=1 Tax=Nesidiocoris tenuis TaxID=355587 RepID=A0A6H5GIG9_9HEMI|nr:unnamed protein product [Nesidiocoris tenuis]
MFYIGNDFYIDCRPANSVDYSEAIIKWGQREGFQFGRVRQMEETTIGELGEIRLGWPYLYRHLADCEHLIIFTDARLLHPLDPMDSSNRGGGGGGPGGGGPGGRGGPPGGRPGGQFGDDRGPFSGPNRGGGRPMNDRDGIQAEIQGETLVDEGTLTVAALVGVLILTVVVQAWVVETLTVVVLWAVVETWTAAVVEIPTVHHGVAEVIDLTHGATVVKAVDHLQGTVTSGEDPAIFEVPTFLSFTSVSFVSCLNLMIVVDFVQTEIWEAADHLMAMVVEALTVLEDVQTGVGTTSAAIVSEDVLEVRIFSTY